MRRSYTAKHESAYYYQIVKYLKFTFLQILNVIANRSSATVQSWVTSWQMVVDRITSMQGWCRAAYQMQGWFYIWIPENLLYEADYKPDLYNKLHALESRGEKSGEQCCHDLKPPWSSQTGASALYASIYPETWDTILLIWHWNFALKLILYKLLSYKIV